MPCLIAWLIAVNQNTQAAASHFLNVLFRTFDRFTSEKVGSACPGPAGHGVNGGLQSARRCGGWAPVQGGVVAVQPLRVADVDAEA
mmetsp:Transcript_15959/g.47959  ORF Transcript_15959/g.47959 Transcript_15959/m.47959 type:complete len:86 (+) Transcript_15959:275-532(+)